MFRSVLRRGALTAENRHAWRVDRDRGEDDLLARDAGTEEAADVHVVAERDARSDGLDAGDENAFVGLVDNAKIGGLRLRTRLGTVGLRVNEAQRAVQIFFTHPLQEVEDVLDPKSTRLNSSHQCASRMPSSDRKK